MGNTRFDTVRQLMQDKHLTEALALIKKLHIDVHDQAINHLQVHIHWFCIGYQMQNLKIMSGQILPIIFALPVSFFHRSFGLAIKAHKAE